jgi:uncharacterized protein YndB with AHSA1/START domain
MTMDSVTASISIEAPPRAVLEVLGDPERLPAWAPGFAKSVRKEEGEWVVDTGERAVRRHIPVDHARGTVDFLATPDATRGLFTRAVPNGDGTELTFTFVGDGSEEQRAILESELRTLKALSESS